MHFAQALEYRPKMMAVYQLRRRTDSIFPEKISGALSWHRQVFRVAALAGSDLGLIAVSLAEPGI